MTFMRTFTPCTPRHKHCSRWHAELVESYRLERQRQLDALEAETGRYAGDEKLWRERGGTLINFAKWLKCHTTHDAQAIEDCPKSYVAQQKSEIAA